MRICIDPGHGMSNATSGLHDPGATSGKYRECDINLAFAFELERVLAGAGHETMLTRRDEVQPMPVWRRAAKAHIWKADVLISLHCNSATPAATGVEIQYRDDEDKGLADLMLPYLLRASGLRDHGNDQRIGLSVLQFAGPAILIELGFLTNPKDLAVLLNLGKRVAMCEGIRDALAVWRSDRAAARVVRETCAACGAVKN